MDAGGHEHLHSEARGAKAGSGVRRVARGPLRLDERAQQSVRRAAL